MPLIWGLWAVLAPLPFVSQRLPLWGAILGLIAGILAGLILNLPSRFLGEPVPLAMRGAAVLGMVVFYYLLWMLVQKAYRFLTTFKAGR